MALVIMFTEGNKSLLRFYFFSCVSKYFNLHKLDYGFLCIYKKFKTANMDKTHIIYKKYIKYPK